MKERTFQVILALGLGDGEESFLGDRDAAELLHAGLAFFLLVQEFQVTSKVPSMELGVHVLTVGLDGFAGDNLATNGDLNRDFKR